MKARPSRVKARQASKIREMATLSSLWIIWRSMSKRRPWDWLAARPGPLASQSQELRSLGNGHQPHAGGPSASSTRPRDYLNT